MPLSLSSLFLGFVLGVAATSIVWNLSTRTIRNPETAKLTKVWSINDVTAPGVKPAILAQRIGDMPLPAGSKVLVPQGAISAVAPAILAECEVRMHPDVHVNAAIGRDRALIFTGHVSRSAHAMFTLEDATVRRLQGDFQRMWADASPYVEATKIADLAGKNGRVVEVTGKASEVLEYKGRKMLRLMEGGQAIGIVTRQGDVAQYTGTMVRVVGRVARDNGYAYVEADRIEPVGAPVAVPVN